MRSKVLWPILFSLLAISALNAQEAQVSEESELEEKLRELHIPDDEVSPTLSEDQLHVVNTRYSSLINRHEISLQGTHNFTSESHLRVRQAALSYRYHLNDRWSFGLRYVRHSNKLSEDGRFLLDDQKIVPDTDYALNAREIFASYNTIYGKMRLSQRRVLYFDQYISLGAGQTKLASDQTPHAFLDLGFAFWLSRWGSLRVGMKNEIYEQVKRSGEEFRYNAMGYLEFGYLFGLGNYL